MHKEKVHFLGDLRIIGTIRDTSNKICSYVLMDEHSHKFDIVNNQVLIGLLTKKTFVNAALEKGKVINTECAMQRLPIFNEHMQVIENFGITILGELVQNNKNIGYKILDTQGNIVNIKYNELLQAINMQGVNIINGKILKKDNKQIISAIKKKYTVVEIIEDRKEQAQSKKVNNKQLYRYTQHRNKLYNILIPNAMTWLFTNENRLIKDKWWHTEVDKYGKLGRAFNIGNEARIIYSEIIKNKIKLTDKDKELLKKLITETKNYKGVIREYTQIKLIDELYIAAFCQFLFNDKDYAEKALSKLDKHKALNFNKIRKLKEEGWACDSLLEVEKKLELNKIKKDKIANEKYQKALHTEKRKEFKQISFSTAKEIAQLGFALHEKDNYTQYTTETGFHKTLKYLGDIVPNYEIYKPKSKCLGDLLVIASIEKLLDCMEYENGTVNNIYQDFYAIPGIIETLIVIAYIYGSEAVRFYVDDNKDKIYETLSNIEDFEDLPNFNILAYDKFNIPSCVKIYYESGFNVFLNDSHKNKGGENYKGYSKSYLREAKYINYRQLGNRREIQHVYLRDNLCSIVKRFTSCDPEIVEDHIGKLRFF